MNEPTGDDLWAVMRSDLIHQLIALQIEKGLDYESFVFGLHLALTDPVLGGWFAEAFDRDKDTAARLRHTNEQKIARLREQLEKPAAWGNREGPATRE